MRRVAAGGVLIALSCAVAMVRGSGGHFDVSIFLIHLFEIYILVYFGFEHIFLYLSSCKVGNY